MLWAVTDGQLAPSLHNQAVEEGSFFVKSAGNGSRLLRLSGGEENTPSVHARMIFIDPPPQGKRETCPFCDSVVFRLYAQPPPTLCT